MALITATRMTAAGRGAVATILLNCVSEQGLAVVAASPFQAVNGLTLLQQSINRTAFGRWGGDLGEEVVICRVSDREWEIHCHGGFAATESILADLRGLGATITSWDEQVELTHGILRRECEVALTKATTMRTARTLLSQETIWRTWIGELSDLLLADERELAGQSIQRVLARVEFGRHLTEPFRVVLTGRPNVGKSSLINALVGFQRSIVFDQPGTTRDVVTAETAWDGWPVLLADTAGLRENAEGLEADGIGLARQQIDQADLILNVLDANSTSEASTWQEVGLRPIDLDPDKRSRTVTIANKIDLIPNDRPDHISRVQADFLVSAVTGEGLEHLITELGHRLVSNEPPEDVPIAVSPALVNWLKQLQRELSSDADTAEIVEFLRSLL